MKSFNGLSEQLFSKNFRPMLFSIYNIAEEERYLVGLEQMGFEYGIEDLECLLFDTMEMEERELNAFKSYIEDTVQKGNVLVGIFVVKGNKLGMAAVKPRKIDIIDVLK